MAKQSKEAERQTDIARQRESAQAVLTQLLSQLLPGSPEYLQLQTEGSRLLQGVAGPEDEEALIRQIAQPLIQQQQAKISRGEAASPLEARTNLQVGKLREAAQPVDFEQDLLGILSGRPPTTQAGRLFLASIQHRPEEQDVFGLLEGRAPTTQFGRIQQEGLEYQPEEQDIFRLLRGEAPTTSAGRTFGEGMAVSPEDAAILSGLRGEPSTAPTAGLVSDIAGRARAPVGDIDSFNRFTSTFPQQLELVRQNVEGQFARRGITPTSGLALEGLGRAGVEASIAEEQQSRDAYQRASALREQEFTRRNQAIQQFLAFLDAGRAIPGERTAATERLFNVGQELQATRQGTAGQLFGTGQQLQAGQEAATDRLYGAGEGLRDRQIGVEDSLVNLQLGRETNLTNLMTSRTERGLANQEGLLQRERGFAQDNLIRAEQRDEQRRQEIIKLAALAGSVAVGGIGAAAFPAVAAASGITGGALARAGQGALMTATGGQVGLPNFGRGTSLTELLGEQRKGSVVGGGSIAGGLSRLDPLEDSSSEPLPGTPEWYRRYGRRG